MLGDQFMSLRRENMAKKSTSELNSNNAGSDLIHSVLISISLSHNSTAKQLLQSAFYKLLLTFLSPLLLK